MSGRRSRRLSLRATRHRTGPTIANKVRILEARASGDHYCSRTNHLGPFLSLPVELRARVYTCIFTSLRIQTRRELKIEEAEQDYDVVLNLMLTCKTIKSEVMDILPHAVAVYLPRPFHFPHGVPTPFRKAKHVIGNWSFMGSERYPSVHFHAAKTHRYGWTRVTMYTECFMDWLGADDFQSNVHNGIESALKALLRRDPEILDFVQGVPGVDMKVYIEFFSAFWRQEWCGTVCLKQGKVYIESVSPKLDDGRELGVKIAQILGFEYDHESQGLRRVRNTSDNYEPHLLAWPHDHIYDL